MRHLDRPTRALLWLAAVGTAACTPPGGPDSTQNWDWRPDAGAAGNTPTKSAICAPAPQASEPLPARVNAIAGEGTAAGGANKMYTEDLFYMFKANCGGCHVDGTANQGNFHVNQRTFTTDVSQTTLDAIRNEDPAKAMPPQGKAFSTRPANDPVAILADLMAQWIQQGRPAELFLVGDSSSDPGIDPNDPNASPYLVSPQVGTDMTNIGNCVPGAAMVGTSTDVMDKMDQKFAAMKELGDLPQSLKDTDLSTLDTAELARDRVIAYVPQYPLWTDDAGKLRYIRVPKGQSITFDKATQRFQIPANTRFYKTFLRQVIDRDGNQTYRKIETRVIVTRPDKKLPDGTVQTAALFATYLWNDDETKADLNALPLRSGEPFTDVLLNITIDEPREQAIRDSNPKDLATALKAPGIKRHYAVPGGQRCIQCHMGSVNEDFILGFLPLQIARRASGTAGAYEDTGPDELNQLARLIDYGVITGMAPADVLPLEQSEGTRAPRNDYELKAQAYLLGNCAHCHNPRGFPSVKNPDLKDTLDFMPSASGGVFQFSLETYSPLRKRGIDQEIKMPYITPSMYEYPVDTSVGEPSLRAAMSANWAPKSVPDCAADTAEPFICGAKKKGPAHLLSPWRSLIYRNTDTPFMYADDFVVFPHMPMNSPGYDCRASRIMADWMVSIPSTRKHPEIAEDSMPGVIMPPMGQVPFDTSEQPYAEVPPGAAGYDDAVAAAADRLKKLHDGGRYTFCPDTSDIVDPAVVKAAGLQPIVPLADPVLDAMDLTKELQPGVGVPNHAHWVVTDVTDPPGDWVPRRSDWKSFVVDGMVDMSGLPVDEDVRAQVLTNRTNVIEALKTATVAAVKDFALTDIPYGTWKVDSRCDFSKDLKVADFDNTHRPRPYWMDADPNNLPAADAPVYMMSPGAAVFTNVCINCHGPQADSKGVLADAIMNMTGGTARVANFRDGLFGPITAPGGNGMRVFGGSDVPKTATSDDWAGRYMAFMALGGTAAVLPDAILNIIGVQRVLGTPRGKGAPSERSANMLRLAQSLCHQVLPITYGVLATPLNKDTFFPAGVLKWGDLTGLIDSNADAETWLKLCSLGHTQIIRVADAEGGGWLDKNVTVSISPLSFSWADRYPAGAPVLDHHGQVQPTLTADNLFPICLRKPKDAAQQAAAEAWRADPDHLVGAGKAMLPYCADALFDPTQKPATLAYSVGRDGTTALTDVDKWATRGAVNAGLAVYVYLQKLETDPTAAKVPYNHCELRPKN